ncbi:MAG: DUF4250 domain-containing protein [Paramuribaculum sp.]|nr:DUF4250 domain-containing protein [Paramuribaculum sp.]
MEHLPSDPAMLLSVVNTKLRDQYPNGLDEMCNDMGLDRAILEKKLAEAGFEYSPTSNKFW